MSDLTLFALQCIKVKIKEKHFIENSLTKVSTHVKVKVQTKFKIAACQINVRKRL